MSRIHLVEAAQAPLRARKFFANGNPGPIVSSFAHVPELLETALPFIGAIFGASALSVRLKEIVVLRASARMQCRYCVETHTAVALSSGLSRDEVVALRNPDPAHPRFPGEREHALLRWTDALTATGPIPEALADALKQHFTEAEIVELTLLGGATIMLNRYCTALDLPTSPETLQKLKSAGVLQ